MEYIVSKSLIPVLKQYILKEWKPKDVESDLLIDVIQVLRERQLMNEVSLDEILSELIVPKIVNEVKQSNFLEEEM